MSGHSKWSSIKHKKGAADAKRGKLFSKLTRAIIVAAREGGRDPAANLALQNAIEKARSYSMPKDNIERAIARGSGAGADTETSRHRLRGLRPKRRRDHRRGADGQPQPDRFRCPARVHEERGQPRHDRSRRVAVRAARDRLVDADGADEDSVTLAAAEGGAEDVIQDGSSFEVTTLARGAEPRSARRSSRPESSRVRRDDDGAEDDDRAGRRGRGPQDASPDRRSSRSSTTSARSTRTSTSRSVCSKLSQAD